MVGKEITGENMEVIGWWTGSGVYMAFERGVMPEEWRSVVIVPLYQGKGERNECKNYRAG